MATQGVSGDTYNVQTHPLPPRSPSISPFEHGYDKQRFPALQSEIVQAETRQIMNDFTFGQPTESLKSMQQQVNDLKQILDCIAGQFESPSGVRNAGAATRLQALRDQAAHLDLSLAGAEPASEPSWDGVKSGLRKSTASASRGFQEVRQWLSDKIAP
jgi:hypothetical protein